MIDKSTEAVARQLAQIVVRGLAAGHAVEIDGLGVFHPDAEKGCRFEASTAPRVFIAHAKEDSGIPERLNDDLEQDDSATIL